MLPTFVEGWVLIEGLCGVVIRRELFFLVLIFEMLDILHVGIPNVVALGRLDISWCLLKAFLRCRHSFQFRHWLLEPLIEPACALVRVAVKERVADRWTLAQ